MQRHTIKEVVNHSRSTGLERSEIYSACVCVYVCVCGGGGGGGFNRFHVATTLALSSAVVYTRHCSVRNKGF